MYMIDVTNYGGQTTPCEWWWVLIYLNKMNIPIMIVPGEAG